MDSTKIKFINNDCNSHFIKNNCNCHFIKRDCEPIKPNIHPEEVDITKNGNYQFNPQKDVLYYDVNVNVPCEKATWGDIEGDIQNQSDLMDYVNEQIQKFQPISVDYINQLD